MKKITLNAGDKFNRWTVLSEAEPRIQASGRKRSQHLCRCDCGAIATIVSWTLTTGHSKSCGCYKTEGIIARTTTHGMTNTQEHKCWQNMKSRCYNTKVRQYRDYGGRGITVCDRWLNDFEAFYADMGAMPSAKHTIERMDNSLGYSPDNCYWATRSEQNNNNRRNRLITINGVTRNITQWAAITGKSRSAITARIDKLGWDAEKAVHEPVTSHAACVRQVAAQIQRLQAV